MRESKLARKTKETDINIELKIDEYNESSINTGIGFMDHMLELFAFHSGVSLKVDCQGDLNVDGHNSVEDIGIL